MEPPRSPARFTGKRVLHNSSLAQSLSNSNPNISSLTPAPNANAASRAAVRGKMLNMIFQAASDGDIPRFKSLLVRLDSGRGRLKETVEALRVKDAGLLEGLGALHVAACRERLEVCRYLIEELQVDVNGVDKGGRTPLFFAILCKGVRIAKYLLDHGANPNKINNDGISPLHQATVSGNGEAVKLLLAKGAYVDPVASCGTPLHCAASKGHDDIMKILLGHNADRKRQDDAWFKQRPKGQSKQSENLAKNCNKLVNGKSPLNTATDANSKNCMLLLLKAGADRKGAAAYAAEKLQSEKVVSTEFVNCIMGDVAANRILPDDLRFTFSTLDACRDESESKRKIRVSGFQKLASFSFKGEEYHSAAMSYTVGGNSKVPTRRVCAAYKGSAEFVGNHREKALLCFHQVINLMRADYCCCVNLMMAIKFDPNNATLYSNRSLCWLHIGEGDKALLDASECRKLRPDWPKACYRQGAALMLLKDYEGASEHFLDGLKLDPANTEMEDALRKAYDAMKDVSKHQGLQVLQTCKGRGAGSGP
ncbi:hypothetical protein VPH35_015601 [Triticum aestivum]